ncbi:Thylakoid lumenal protein [Acorus gramineus]|uniref:Thylakoid lumenal protein n=1 Tax=Acorus gramineus TaxID=55184 RepID=A0AAV9A7Y5_ACOGR|nr:Thylakoid lumenal protein [Acorus gramineus]
MASASLLTPPPQIQTKKTIIPVNNTSINTSINANAAGNYNRGRRREMTLSLATAPLMLMMIRAYPALASSMDEEYVKETSDIINKIRTTINKNKTDPDVASAVAELREASNDWVAKYRREKALLGRVSFRDMYSALNAVSGHYISFGPTAPIPTKRKARILEEMDTVEKALLRGR